jgi:hypothetical protein
MTWFDIHYQGVAYVENLTGADEKVLVGLGFHGYATQLQAQAHPQNANFAQMLIAANILAGHPTGGVNTPGAPAIANTAQGAGAVATAENPLVAVGDFFHRLTEASTWARVGEFVVGAMLIYVGIRAVASPEPVVRGVKKTGTVAGAVVRNITPTGRATRTVARHKARVKASDTRRHAANIRAKRKEFGRREIYR